jgi:hypothetical protein
VADLSLVRRFASLKRDRLGLGGFTPEIAKIFVAFKVSGFQLEFATNVIIEPEVQNTNNPEYNKEEY